MILQQLFGSYAIQVCLCIKFRLILLRLRSYNIADAHLSKTKCNQWKLETYSRSWSQVLISSPLMMIIGEVISSDVETYGASAHSDYGTVTLLLTDEVPGLQVMMSLDSCHHAISLSS